MLKTIRLELARTKEFPDGNRDRGYEFKAPVGADGHLDTAAWPGVRKQCTVRRFWPGEDDRLGELHHTRHRSWAFSYEPGDEDDENFHRLDAHVFKVGEYVSIREPDGEVLTFRIAAIS